MAAAERRARVVELKREGLTHREIGERLGVSEDGVSKAYRRAVAEYSSGAVEAMRVDIMARLDRIFALTDDFMSRTYVAVSNGRIVIDEDGTPVEDIVPALEAARTSLTALNQLRDLVGANAPKRTQVDVAAPVRVEIVGVNPDDLT